MDRRPLQVVSFCPLTCTWQWKSWCITQLYRLSVGFHHLSSLLWRKIFSPVLISADISIHPITHIVNMIKQICLHTCYVIHWYDYLEEELAKISPYVGIAINLKLEPQYTFLVVVKHLTLRPNRKGCWFVHCSSIIKFSFHKKYNVQGRIQDYGKGGAQGDVIN